MMLVAKIEPQVFVARGLADDWEHVRQAGAAAHPGPCVEPVAERKQLSGDLLGLVDLHGRRRGVAAGEFGAAVSLMPLVIGAST